MDSVSARPVAAVGRRKETGMAGPGSEVSRFASHKKGPGLLGQLENVNVMDATGLQAGRITWQP
jgi:hypothetical protein